TVRVTTQESIKNLPFRGLQSILALEAGVIEQNGVLYVRGGRSNEIKYMIDGGNVTNPYFNSENISVIQEAIEETQLQSGGYTAEFGGANSAIVRTTLRSGGTEYHGSFDIQTDDFAKPGSKFLGASSTGYRNIVGTFSGQVPSLKGVRFFVAGQSFFRRNDDPRYIIPFKFDNLVTDKVNGLKPQGTKLPGPIEFKENYLYNNYTDDRSAQGKLTVDLGQIKVNFTGSASQNYSPAGGEWPNAIGNYFNQSKNSQRKTERIFANLRATHVLNPTTFYEVGISYQQRKASSYDEEFGSKWYKYTDSLYNAGRGWEGRYQGPSQYLIINNFGIADENAPINGYSKNRQSGLGFTVDLTSQLSSQWELKAGGSLDSWTIRNFSIGSIRARLEYENGVDGKSPAYNFGAPGANIDSLTEHRRVNLSRKGGMSFFGYDVDGKQVDSGPDAPFKPLFASAYVQNKMEFSDLIVNFGFRFEYMDNKALMPDNLENPTNYDRDLEVLDNSTLVEREPFSFLLPRISFSFPVTENTVFFAQYGKFVQMPALNQIYTSNVGLSDITGPLTRSPYGYFGQFAGFTARPERQTKYEVGIRQMLTDNFAFTITGFYNDMRDQLQQGRVLAERGTILFSGWTNEEFGTTKGVELTLELRRTTRLMARVNYTLQDARGTGSSLSSSRVTVSDVTARYPNFISLIDQNQTHRGSLMLDYRYPKGDGGKVLEGMGVNVLLTFNSGHPYTKLSDQSFSGQTTPWNVGVRMLGDVRNRFPIEPINNSTTPWVFNVDLNFSKVFYFPWFNAEFYVNVLNLFDTKNIINVYPTTGTAQDDGWLRNPAATSQIAIPDYAAFYKAINLDNQWGYKNQTGLDMFGNPRQVRVGIKLEM
ncbi:MAG TPA: TonB-dependent receptor, partial [Bacteroidota bacterium]|nr:TonB-dependent receptor [Bacteroidota bacterium]